MLDRAASLSAYLNVDFWLGVSTIALGMVLSASSFWLKKLGHGLAKDAEAAGRDVAPQAAESRAG